MPGCTDTCSCNIQAGPGITITGSGTPSNPFVVTSGLDLSQALRVNDTDTINLTLTGSGTVQDPFTLRGDATMKLTKLADVSDPEGGPAVGESPVWVGTGQAGHWEFKTPAPNPAGSVNTGAGLTGTGAAATPLAVKTLNAPGGATTGLEVYVDSAGNLRAVAPLAQAVDWSTIQNKPTEFNPAPHKHPASDITDPLNLNVGKINGVKITSNISASSSPPTTGNTAGDLFFRRAA